MSCRACEHALKADNVKLARGLCMMALCDNKTSLDLWKMYVCTFVLNATHCATFAHTPLSACQCIREVSLMEHTYVNITLCIFNFSCRYIGCTYREGSYKEVMPTYGRGCLFEGCH